MHDSKLAALLKQTVGVLAPSDLLSLEQYHAARPKWRPQAMAYRQCRRLAVGPNMTWCFESRFSIWYQIQEILRSERIFDSVAIEEELAAYNPLIPDGQEWKVTMLIEYPDPKERQAALQRLRDIETCAWMRVASDEAVYAIADEDLPRSTEDKTSAVHFLRFPLTASSARSVAAGAALSAGVSHAEYGHQVDPLPSELSNSLRLDIQD